MNLRSLDAKFGKVQGHLARLGVHCELDKFPVVAKSILQKATEKLPLPLPEQLRDFYLHYSNGISFFWEHGEKFGAFQLPLVQELAEVYAGWQEQGLWMDNYDFAGIDDIDLAKKTYAGMKSWLPLMEEGNGDIICISCDENTPVVFDQHDWHDGGNGTNGHRLAPDRFGFIEDWASVCFSQPKSHYWPSTFSKTGVSWTRKNFDKLYFTQV